MRRLPIAALACLCASLGWASDFSSSARGTTAGAFLKLGVGARAVAMGEAFSAAADDATALYWNPAGLTRIEKRSATFMHAVYISDSYFDYLAFGSRVGNSGAVGISGQYLSAGKINETDATGSDVGSFRPNDAALTVGYAHSLDLFSVGLSVKYIQSQIIATAQTWAFDAGLLTKPYMDGKLRFGFAATNMGGRLRFEREAEELPVTLRAGLAYKLQERWLVSLDGAAARDEGPHAAIGTEYELVRGKDLTFAMRLGFNSRNFSDIDGIRGISAGIGLGYESLSIDYAFIPLGGLGIAHRASVSVKF